MQALLRLGQNLNVLGVVVVAHRHVLLLLCFEAATSLALLLDDLLLACHLFCRVLIQTLDLHVSLVASQSLLVFAACGRVDSFLARGVGAALSDERVGSTLGVLLLGAAVGQGIW